MARRKADIAFRQETYRISQDENFGKTQWKGKTFFFFFYTAPIINHSKGALILVRQGVDFEHKTIECDPNGRYIF